MSNEELTFLEKERDYELSMAANGLHSGTVIAEKQDGLTHKIELHWNPEQKVLVEVDNWWVADGEDDVMPEFEVMAVYHNVSDAFRLAASYK